MINIDHLPVEIHSAINHLAKDIDFTSESEKGANGYVLLGCNKILEREVAVKFYFWEGSRSLVRGLLFGADDTQGKSRPVCCTFF